MKRSESVLVYSVTSVLAVILAVAIIFGEGPPQQPADPDVEQLVDLDADELDPVDPGGTPGSGETERDLLDEILKGSGLEFDDPVDPQPEPDPIVTELPLNRTVATLGVSRTEENPASGDRYRIVEVRRGDVLSGIVQRWCPGVDAEIVAALNETIDPKRLRPGQEICLPWVDDEMLLEAYDARSTRSVEPAVANTGPSPAVPASVGREYTIKKNESLWVIAARKVGANKAKAYIDQIVAANAKITDPARVREGMKIVLP